MQVRSFYAKIFNKIVLRYFHDVVLAVCVVKRVLRNFFTSVFLRQQATPFESRKELWKISTWIYYHNSQTNPNIFSDNCHCIITLCSTHRWDSHSKSLGWVCAYSLGSLRFPYTPTSNLIPYVYWSEFKVFDLNNDIRIALHPFIT